VTAAGAAPGARGPDATDGPTPKDVRSSAAALSAWRGLRSMAAYRHAGADI
jgi:hypothetical protein